jgi:hypothetical protein
LLSFCNPLIKCFFTVFAKDRLFKAADRQKLRCDLTCNTREYKVGDGVLLQDNRKYKGRSPKLQNKWEGPYTITSKISDLLYRIHEGLHTRSKVIHINILKPFENFILSCVTRKIITTLLTVCSFKKPVPNNSMHFVHSVG